MSKSVLVLDGRIDEDSFADRLLHSATEWLADAGWGATVVSLRDLEIAPCVGCFGCWIKTPGECVIADAGRDVARQIVGSDLVVYLTPVLFGGYSYELKKAVDRSIPIISPLFRLVDGEVHHKGRYAQYPRMLALGWAQNPTAEKEDLFSFLVERNAINMLAPKALAVVFDRQENEAAMTQRIDQAFTEVAGA